MSVEKSLYFDRRDLNERKTQLVISHTRRGDTCKCLHIMINGLLDTFLSFRIILLQISRHYRQSHGANFLQHTKDNNWLYRLAFKTPILWYCLALHPKYNKTQNKSPGFLASWDKAYIHWAIYSFIFGILPSKHFDLSVVLLCLILVVQPASACLMKTCYFLVTEAIARFNSSAID